MTRRWQGLTATMLATLMCGCSGQTAPPSSLNAPAVLITMFNPSACVAQLQTVKHEAVTMKIPRDMTIKNVWCSTQDTKAVIVVVSTNDGLLSFCVDMKPDSYDFNYKYNARVLDPQLRRQYFFEDVRTLSDENLDHVNVTIYDIQTATCSGVATLLAYPDKVIVNIPGGTSTYNYGAVAMNHFSLFVKRRDNGWYVNANSRLPVGCVTLHDLFAMVDSIVIDPNQHIPTISELAGRQSDSNVH